MTVGDTVIARQALDSAVAGGGGSIGVLIGQVTAEDAGPPATADVLWENGRTSAAVPQSELKRVFVASDAGSALVGKWVQLATYPEGIVASKSPAASGVCVRALRGGAYGAGVPNTEDLLVVAEGNSGRLFAGFQDTEVDEADWRVNDGRRAV